MIKPESIVLLSDRQSTGSDYERTNIKKGTIEVVTFLGVIVRSLVKLAGQRIIVDITETEFEGQRISMGDTVSLYFPPGDFLAFRSGGT